MSDEISKTEEQKETQLDRILLAARTTGASDVHFKVGYKPIIRVHGKLEDIDKRQAVPTKILDEASLAKIIKSILSEPKQIYLFEHKNVDASLEVKTFDRKTNEEKIYRHRINAGYSREKPFVAIRLIPEEIMPVQDIGFPFDFDVWQDITELRRGLVLVTGVTGSGKTTTLASLIQEINGKRAEHIITLEDPIEYTYKPIRSIISQRELGIDFHSFADGVKYALREDPDIILVGEIRDRETALHALEATATGHLVFSTLHTMSVAETARRYVNIFEAEDHENIRTSLAANLTYVLSQQLIPCRRGTKTRKLAMEVMNVKDSPAIKNHLREGEYHKIISEIQTGRKYKMITMDDHIKELCLKGEIDIEDAITQAYEPEKLKEELRKMKLFQV